MKAKIKTWDQMAEEFGVVDSFRSIKTECWFTPNMEEALPEDRIIHLEAVPGETYYTWNEWNISKDTIECFIDEDDEEVGIKHDNGKPPVGLLFEDFPRALKKVALVSGHGCKEYGRHNWDKLEDGQERYRDAQGRHILDRAIEGEISAETGLYHLAQVVWNGLAELELYLRSKENA